MFGQREGYELAPAVIESWIIGEILVNRWQDILDSLFWYLADIESFVAFLGEGVCIESNQRVFGPMFLERVVEGQKTREIFCVRDQCGPDCYDSTGGLRMACSFKPLGESVVAVSAMAICRYKKIF